MKMKEIKVGETYAVKVSGRIVPVKIKSEGENYKGRRCWTGENTVTGRTVSIRSAAKLRYVWGDKQAHLAYLRKQRGEPKGAEQSPDPTSTKSTSMDAKTNLTTSSTAQSDGTPGKAGSSGIVPGVSCGSFSVPAEARDNAPANVAKCM